MAFNAQAGNSQPYTPQGGAQSLGAAYDVHPQPQYQGYDPQGFGLADTEAETYSDRDHAGAAPSRLGGFVNVLGAVASLALIAGIAVWGYQLIARDVSGVPVVRSVEGPMRVQPETPGGTPADNQGLAVNAVAAHGIAAEPADRLTLAPTALSLADDDQPMTALIAAEASASDAEAAGSTVTQDALGAFQSGDINALVAELTAGVTPLDGHGATQVSAVVPVIVPVIVPPTAVPPDDSVALVPSPEMQNAPGIKISLRPQVRPARFSPSQGQGATTQGQNPAEVDAASLPIGTRLAQLGAYESAAVARAEWDQIYTRFGDYLEGKKRVIQKAESGGRIFYRLRAMGFADLSDARRFCSALIAGKADCIPVITR